MPKVRAEARKALALNPSNVDAQALLGSVAASYDYDWPEAERIRATLAHSTSSMAVFLGIYCLMPHGRIGEVMELLQRALQQDPMNALLRTILGFMFNWAGMPEKGIAEMRKVLEVDEGHYFAHFCLGEIHADAGRLSEALEAAERAYQLAPWHPRVVGSFAGALARTGNQSRADDLIHQLQATPSPHGIPMGMICYHLTRGNPEASIEWFEKAVQLRETLVLVYVSDPRVQTIRSSARWAALMRVMNLSDAAA
jgi:tetratricopeptide (TPR) repeat protein